VEVTYPFFINLPLVAASARGRRLAHPMSLSRAARLANPPNVTHYILEGASDAATNDS